MYQAYIEIYMWLLVTIVGMVIKHIEEQSAAKALSLIDMGKVHRLSKEDYHKERMDNSIK